MDKILIIGGGGREHSLAWKLKKSPKVGEVFVAPGNAGTSEIATNVNITAIDVIRLAEFAEKNAINFTVVGSDDSLALGIVDEFKRRGLKIWGPVQAAAQIESSKAFAKELMKQNNIPTADYEIFKDYNKALEYIKAKGTPIVIKASGLALGKGVMVCQNLDEAEDFLRDCMINKIFGIAGTEVVIEEFLQGREFSTHALSDGKNIIIFPPSQDHKRVFDGDKGLNTGGMGTIAPLSWVTKEMMDKVSSTIAKPTIDGLRKLEIPFIGLLYPGLMMIEADKSADYNDVVRPFMGQFKVIEFNSRLGDPECESYMRLLKSDLYEALTASTDGNLSDIKLEWNSGYACCIMLASGGYPGSYEKGKEITGVEKATQLKDIIIFHAGTKIQDGKLVTNGGRVLGVTAIGDDLQSTLDKAYQAIKLIHFEGMHYRTDIGRKSLANGQVDKFISA